MKLTPPFCPLMSKPVVVENNADMFFQPCIKGSCALYTHLPRYDPEDPEGFCSLRYEL